MASANTPAPAAHMSLGNYRFPTQRLRTQLREPGRQPLVLVAPGSFSPITFLHLRMFEMAADFTRFNTANFEVIGGYLSPVSDAYRKPGLAAYQHRVAMCELAAEHTSNWLMVDPWEAMQPEYVPTAKVLDHFADEINRAVGEGVLSADGTERLRPKIAVLAGADLIQTMSQPGVWDPKDLAHILGKFAVFIVERTGTDLEQALGAVSRWKDNIYVIQQVFQNNMSSTQVRLHLKRDMSVRYLIPEVVIDYIEAHGLYQGENSQAGGKGGPSGVEPPSGQATRSGSS